MTGADELSEQERQAIVAKLEDVGASRSCAACGNPNFRVTAGIVQFPVQADLNVTRVGGPSVPSAVLSCTNCGNVRFHALGGLGLLEETEDTA